MAASSSIEWTDATWNPVTGCDRVSEGCENCYALALARRLKAMGNPRYQLDGNPKSSGPGFGLSLHEDVLRLPLSWRTPRFVFVNSMSDLFHPRVPVDFIGQVFEVMAEASSHTFQILTKRPERMARIVAELCPDWLPNVWLGCSIESQRFLSRVEAVRSTPARVHFLSLEPLLGPLPGLELTGIEWVIVGGESGHKHRPVELKWVRQIRDQCVEADVAFFFKQVGGRTPKAGGRMLDGRTWDQMPAPPA
ncbi:MAG: phage Gp37/Gp68 family protein [Actinomycetota bacterium]